MLAMCLFVTHRAEAGFHCLQLYHSCVVSLCSVGRIEFRDEKQLLEGEQQQELTLAARGQSFWKCFGTSEI